MRVSSENVIKESKYSPLWAYINTCHQSALKLSFEEIEGIAGVPLDHSFLNCKKELEEYGYRVGKISMKDKTVLFERISGE